MIEYISEVSMHIILMSSVITGATHFTVSDSLVKMRKCSFQQVGEELFNVRHVLSWLDVWTKSARHFVHLYQTEHVCEYRRMHQQT